MSERLYNIFLRFCSTADAFSGSFTFKDEELRALKHEIELSFEDSIYLGFSKDKKNFRIDVRQASSDLKKAVKEKKAVVSHE